MIECKSCFATVDCYNKLHEPQSVSPQNLPPGQPLLCARPSPIVDAGPFGPSGVLGLPEDFGQVGRDSTGCNCDPAETT